MSDELDELMLDLLNHTDDEGTWEAKVYGVLEALRERLPRGGSRSDGPVLSDEMTCRECGGTGTVPLTERVFPSGASEGDVDDPLVKYAHHLPGCAYLAPYGENDPEPECDCGLNKAISNALSAPAASEPEPDEPAPGGGDGYGNAEGILRTLAHNLTTRRDYADLEDMGYAIHAASNEQERTLAAKDEELRKLRDDSARQDAEALNSGFVAGAASRDAEVARLTRQSIAAQKDRDYYQSRCAQVEEAHAALREQVAAADEALAACRAEAGGRIETLTAERDEFEQVASDRLRIIHRLGEEKRSMKASWDDACEQDEVENERKDARIEALTAERDEWKRQTENVIKELPEKYRGLVGKEWGDWTVWLAVRQAIAVAEEGRDAARDEAMRMREALSEIRERMDGAGGVHYSVLKAIISPALTPAPGKGGL